MPTTLSVQAFTGVFLTASGSPDEKSLTLVLVPFIVADVLKKVIPDTQDRRHLRKTADPGKVHLFAGRLNY